MAEAAIHNKDPHQPYPDVELSEEALNIRDVERMEGEGVPVSFEGDLGPVTPKAHLELLTPKTIPPEEGWEDETVEGGGERELVSPRARDRTEEFQYQTVRGCSCDCPRCPEECPPTCVCAGHKRHGSEPPVTGDEP
jgi:hypothetical protein